MLRACFQTSAAKNAKNSLSGRLFRIAYRSTSNKSSSSKKPDDEEESDFWKGAKKAFESMDKSNQKIAAGYGTKKWRFYLEDLVFKNLKPDVVPPGYRMCYRSGLETFANFSVLGAGFMTLVFPWMITIHFMNIEQSQFEFHELTILTMGSLATIASLYFISLKVPLRIYYSEENDNYLVFTPSLIPYRTRKLVVRPGELIPPPKVPSAYLPWDSLQHTHKQTGTKLLISHNQFALPVYYNKLLGYDK